MCEILDRQGDPASPATVDRLAKRHSLKVINISELAEYRRYTEKTGGASSDPRSFPLVMESSPSTSMTARR